MRIRSLGQEDSLEEGMATHSSILPRKSHGQKNLAGTVHRVIKSQSQLKWLSTAHSTEVCRHWSLVGSSLLVLKPQNTQQPGPLSCWVNSRPLFLKGKSPVNKWRASSSYKWGHCPGPSNRVPSCYWFLFLFCFWLFYLEMISTLQKRSPVYVKVIKSEDSAMFTVNILLHLPCHFASLHILSIFFVWYLVINNMSL